MPLYQIIQHSRRYWGKSRLGGWYSWGYWIKERVSPKESEQNEKGLEDTLAQKKGSSDAAEKAIKQSEYPTIKEVLQKAKNSPPKTPKVPNFGRDARAK